MSVRQMRIGSTSFIALAVATSPATFNCPRPTLPERSRTTLAFQPLACGLPLPLVLTV